MIGPQPGILPASLSEFSRYAQALKGDEKGGTEFFYASGGTAYGRLRREFMPPTADILEFLLNLNLTLAAQESNNHPIQPPGLPASYPTPEKRVTEDCIRVEVNK